jgi:hypothetical protein
VPPGRARFHHEKGTGTPDSPQRFKGRSDFWSAALVYFLLLFVFAVSGGGQGDGAGGLKRGTVHGAVGELNDQVVHDCAARNEPGRGLNGRGYDRKRVALRRRTVGAGEIILNAGTATKCAQQ